MNEELPGESGGGGVVRAWHVASDFGEEDGHMLVYADTRGKAKAIALNNGTWEYERYDLIRCRRAPKFDGAFDRPRVVEDNDELPAGFPPFYCEVGEWYATEGVGL